MDHLCPVCGYPHLELPARGPEGAGSFEICPCCGFQFGVDDDDRGITPDRWRKQWVAEGMKWWSRGQRPPPGWDPAGQMARGIPARPGTAPRVPGSPQGPRSPRRRPSR